MMTNELSVIDTVKLTSAEKGELNQEIDRIISQHAGNRTEINRLVFESVEAMTEADDAQAKLENKGFLKRLWGGLTGSNQRLQNKINSNRAVAQYAGQQTLQKLAEQNLMTFDLITAVNNKLNASVNAVDEEFRNIYQGLNKFLKHNRNELARLETRLEKVEQNVNLLTWQNSIEYQEFDGKEYMDMDDTSKIVCLARDFYEITKGNWSTSDLLLLKTAMSTVDIQPKSRVNYCAVLTEMNDNKVLKYKLLGGAIIKPMDDPSYLITMGTLEKLDTLNNRDAYIVDTVTDYMTSNGLNADRNDVRNYLTSKYLRDRAGVNLDTEVESYDLILDLLYNLRQADQENLLVMSESRLTAVMCEAEQLYMHCQFEEAAEQFEVLAAEGNARAMYFLGEIYTNYLPSLKKDTVKGNAWRTQGAKLGDVLCRLNTAYNQGVDKAGKVEIIEEVLPELIKLAEGGDVFAADELGGVYSNGEGIEKDINKAKQWILLVANHGHAIAMNNLGNLYFAESEYTKANEWYEKAGEAGYDWGWYNLAGSYCDGNGVEKNMQKAVQLYEKAYEIGGAAAGKSANQIGSIYWNEKKHTEAKEWFEKSSEAGYDWSWYNIAGFYCDGRGIERDTQKAIQLYGKTYEIGGAAAGKSANQIGDIYLNEKKYTEANEWYKKAGEAGCDWGWYNLAESYHNGAGVEKDMQKAVQLHEKAYEIGGAVAGKSANQIGNIYWRNERKYTEANEWYKKAGEAGYDFGWYNLAGCYYDGDGVEKDKQKAVQLYEKAYALQGKMAKKSAEMLMNIYRDELDNRKKAQEWRKKWNDQG